MSLSASSALVQTEDFIADLDPIAIIPLEPEALAAQHGLTFADTHDDLDDLSYASLPLGSGRQVTLLRHHHSPQSGTEVCVQYGQQDSAVCLVATLVRLSLSQKDLVWNRQDLYTKVNDSFQECEPTERRATPTILKLALVLQKILSMLSKSLNTLVR